MTIKNFESDFLDKLKMMDYRIEQRNIKATKYDCDTTETSHREEHSGGGECLLSATEWLCRKKLM